MIGCSRKPGQSMNVKTADILEHSLSKMGEMADEIREKYLKNKDKIKEKRQ